MSHHKTTVSQCPIVLKHDFPNESQNYLDEKMDEGQYKKRFRYDRPIAQNKSRRPQTAHNHKTIMNMDSGDLYQKLLDSKKEKKQERFMVKPKKKLNTYNLHQALYNVKKQKEALDDKIKESENVRHYFKENDLCMLAYSGALEYIERLQTGMEESQVEVKPKRLMSSIPRTQSAMINPISLPYNERNELEVEGTSYNLPFSQYASHSKLRPTTATTSVRAQSSTKYQSEYNYNSLQDNQTGIKNHLVEQVDEEDENFVVPINLLRVASQTFLSPSASDQYYPQQMGVRGSKAPRGFMQKGMFRIHSAVGQKIDYGSFPYHNSEARAYQAQRPKTSMQYSRLLKQTAQSTKQMNHLDVIQEMKRQDDIQVKSKEKNQKVHVDREKLAVQGNHMQVSNQREFLDVNYINYIKSSVNTQEEIIKTQKILDEILHVDSLKVNPNHMNKRPMTAISRTQLKSSTIPRIHSSASNNPIGFINIDGSNFNTQTKSQDQQV